MAMIRSAVENQADPAPVAAREERVQEPAKRRSYAMVNKVILVGNLGRDPEVRSLPSGQPVASFSVATSRRFKDRDGQRQ